MLLLGIRISVSKGACEIRMVDSSKGSDREKDQAWDQLSDRMSAG